MKHLIVILAMLTIQSVQASDAHSFILKNSGPNQVCDKTLNQYDESATTSCIIVPIKEVVLYSTTVKFFKNHKLVILD